MARRQRMPYRFLNPVPSDHPAIAAWGYEGERFLFGCQAGSRDIFKLIQSGVQPAVAAEATNHLLFLTDRRIIDVFTAQKTYYEIPYGQIRSVVRRRSIRASFVRVDFVRDGVNDSAEWGMHPILAKEFKRALDLLQSSSAPALPSSPTVGSGEAQPAGATSATPPNRLTRSRRLASFGRVLTIIATLAYVAMWVLGTVILARDTGDYEGFGSGGWKEGWNLGLFGIIPLWAVLNVILFGLPMLLIPLMVDTVRPLYWYGGLGVILLVAGIGRAITEQQSERGQ